MGNTPKVTVEYGNGNILADAGDIDGVGALMGTGTTAGLLGVPKTVFNLDDAVEQGFTEGAEPDMYRHLEEFYGELGLDKELHIMIVANTMTMAQMLDTTNANGAKKLLAASNGKVRLLAVFRHPAGGYNGGANFIDSDVTTAVNNALAFATARVAELIPTRILVEGRVINPAVANTLTPTTLDNGFVGIVLGGSKNDGSGSVGLALGRAVKYGADVKIGAVENGPLSIDTVYIGDKLLKDVVGLEALHGAGFISFMQHPNHAGFYFGIDRMCSTDDYRLLVYGRLIDKAAVIASSYYIKELEGQVDTEDNGNIESLTASHMEAGIEQTVNVAMAKQLSKNGVTALIRLDQGIINTSEFEVELGIRPKGYKSFINVKLGLVSPTVE